MRAIAVSLSVLALAACGPDSDRGDDGGDAGGDDGGCNTRLTGVVYAPNGTLPLYGVDVYVPETNPPAPAPGIACTRCEDDLPGGSLVRTVSRENGSFQLDNVPYGDDVKLVLRVGKWSKTITVPRVEMCQATEIHSSMTALPRNKSEGTLPKIAIVTGGYDSLECLVRRIGVDDAEFTTSDGDGSVHLFTSNGASTFAATHPATGTTFKTGHDLWGNATLLNSYDAAFFGCEGAPDGIQFEKTQAEMDNVKAYSDAGGRVFLTHYHNIWVDGRIGGGGPTPPAEWTDIQTCTNPSGTSPTAAIVDTIENPKGPSFFQWMMNVQAISAGGTLAVQDGRQTCVNIDKDKAEQWLFAEGTNRPQMYQFTTPQSAAEDQRCGKVVMTDMHVVARPGQMAGMPVTTPFPDDCASTPLSPQEKALAFMFFDIASCVGEIL